MIRIQNICKVFNAHSRNRNQVLKDVSFELPEKGLVCIYGKSGSGKTTLLNIIGGLDKQNSGDVYIDDIHVGKNVDRIRNANIGFVFQNYYLEKGYTIAEIMHNAMVIAGFKDEEEIEKRSKEVLDLVDMERFKNKQGDALSGGQKQRVAIARALIKGADIILADEPTGNLDAENTMKIMDIFKEISKTKLVVIVTHEVTLIKKYADSYIQLVDGKLTDKDVIGEVIKYETEKNNIYVDRDSAREVTDGDVNLKVYGNPELKAEDIQIFGDKGKVFVTLGKNVTVLNSQSEKKLVFGGAKEEHSEPVKQVPVFSKSTNRNNGKLFTFGNIFKAQRNSGGERLYSTANIFKQIFIAVIAVVMCFLSMVTFEVTRINVENQMLDENSVYLNIDAYNDVRWLDESLYERVDFFETTMREGSFSYNNMTALSGIKASYVPKVIEKDDTADDFDIVYGEMPKENQVLITRALAETLKKEFRIRELNTDKTILLVLFEDRFAISGIVEGDNPAVYMHKQDYVNFLGVYNSIQFVDPNEIFFKADYVNNTYTTEIVVVEDDEQMEVEETYIELSRNALYKMMPDTVQADYRIQVANSQLRSSSGRTGIEIKNSNLYVRKFNITRDALKTDIRIYIHEDVLKNIFVYLEPNLNSLDNSVTDSSMPTEHYFEISTNGGDQLASLNNVLKDKGIPKIDVASRYEQASSDVLREAASQLTIYFATVVLLFIVYFFIEKSGSIKNSKEYGIYRAIGVKKSNLIYKEAVLAVFNNMICYTAFYLLVSVLMCIRYFIMNVAFGVFVGILAGIYAISGLILVAISLIPYLFVLVKTPSEILARYDI